ncbi:hypothetical protein PZ895_13995 [Mesorhizobium sp. YIM 152430]|uniref:hypothetical protein n=1 Tax=Mesorhizobium sp. YIM 152430 TaxID=3031761 RepID=UPI0023DC4C00|nr:hypothetical protein [Mesorhizobium sp. YIM 152430]MDF1600876.1 hypothetical protein [Mesorhizobium sp. YIM 152430]
MLKKFLCAAVITWSMTLPGAAATVTYLGQQQDSFETAHVFRLEGEITTGDVERLAKAVDRDGGGARVLLELEGPGGDYLTGLSLALELRQRGIKTVVRTGDACFSACAIAFMGGSAELRDPLLSAEDDIPRQAPDRQLERGALVGFHAPYLDVSSSTYTAANVQDAYRDAVDGISLLIRLAGHLYIDPLELPRLLEPDRDSAFMTDTVDAVRALWIEYPDPDHLRVGMIGTFTRTMVTSACVNRWYHRQRRSALSGYGSAHRVAMEFDEGSALLDNGEQGLSFGVRRVVSGTNATWLAYMPISMTEDGRNFVWCVFDPSPGSLPSVFYRPAGTIEELFEPLEVGEGLWGLRLVGDIINPAAGTEGYQFTLLQTIDMVPAHTSLDDVATRIHFYQRTEMDLAKLAR